MLDVKAVYAKTLLLNDSATLDSVHIHVRHSPNKLFIPVVTMLSAYASNPSKFTFL